MSRSVFPEAVDRFEELFDLPHTKVNEALRLTQLKGKASLTQDEQNELVTLTASLRSYMIQPETWNKFCDALVAVQNFFNSEIHVYLEEKQMEWDTYIRNFNYVGKWTAGKSYKFQNLVSNDAGDLFLCLVDHTATTANKPPTSTGSNTTWQRASQKGDKGDIGLNAIYKGDWAASKTYAMGDAVSVGRVGWYDTVTYISKVNSNTNKPPATSPDDWFLYQQLYVGETVPPSVGPGMHFIEVTE